MRTWWKIHSGVKGCMFETFRNESAVAMDWWELGDVTGLHRADIAERTAVAFPGERIRQRTASTQMYLFSHDITQGDGIVTYLPGTGICLAGIVTRAYRYAPLAIAAEWPHLISVAWCIQSEPIGQLPDGTRKRLTLPAPIHRVGQPWCAPFESWCASL